MKSLLKILSTIKSTIGLILFGFYKTSSTIPIFNKKVTIDEYKLFLKRTTINSWGESTKPAFEDGIVVEKPASNAIINSDLSYNDKFSMTLTQNKEKFQYWIDFEQKEGVIKSINISTGDNFRFVTYNSILTLSLIYTFISFDFNLIVVLWLVKLMRLYTFIIILNSLNLLKLHLEYMFEIYFIKFNTV